MTIEDLTLLWNNCTIQITYNSNTFPSYKKIYGHGMAHLRIESVEQKPLPITEAGFRSRYIPETLIKEFGGAVGYVEAWLNDGAKSKRWKKYIANSQQLTLF